jgi:hypothetical protein
MTTSTHWIRDIPGDAPHSTIVPKTCPIGTVQTLVNGECLSLSNLTDDSSLSSASSDANISGIGMAQFAVHCPVGQVLRATVDDGWECSSLTDMATKRDLASLGIIVVVIAIILLAQIVKEWRNK